MLLPIAAIESIDANTLEATRIDAVQIDAVAVGIGARHIEGFDAAMSAERVARDAGIKGIGKPSACRRQTSLDCAPYR